MQNLLNYKIINTTNKINKNNWVVFLHGIGGSSNIWFKQIKEFRKHFNLLLIDLPGHGKNNISLENLKEKTFFAVSDEVIKVLDYLKIKKANFVGISLGTIVIQVLNFKYPQRVKAMILGGAVEHFNTFAKTGLTVLNYLKRIIPFFLLYKLSAFILMPKKRNKEARQVFINEAKKITQKEFLIWYTLIKDALNIFDKIDISDKKNKLYIMGDEDFVFTPYILKQNCIKEILVKCGHVCNIEKANEFNKISIDFLNKIYNNSYNN